MSRKLRETIEFTLGMLALVGLMAAMFLIIGGCGAHRAVVTPTTTPTPDVSLGQGGWGSPLTFPATSSGPAVQPTPIYFDFDKHDIRADQRPGLAQNAAAIQAGALVVLGGHADERGTDAYNLALGLRRAYAVRNYLQDAGVLAEFRCVSFGEERPADPGHNEGAWAQNRRVHFE